MWTLCANGRQVAEVVHEVARAALDEAVVIVQDVPRPIVEHPRVTPCDGLGLGVSGLQLGS